MKDGDMMLQPDVTLLLLIPAIIAGLIAQANITRTYKKYSAITSNQGWTAAQAARMILDQHGLYNVAIETFPGGGLDDHYDPRNNALRLSSANSRSQSVAAIGIAAHEAGHAIQHNLGYAPMRARSAVVPAARIGSSLSWPLLFAGLFLGNYNLAMAGVALFAAAVVFQLITLPVEFNASSRAMSALEAGGILNRRECEGARKVLSAAAMTYVAATLMSITQLLRMMTIARSQRR